MTKKPITKKKVIKEVKAPKIKPNAIETLKEFIYVLDVLVHVVDHTSYWKRRAIFFTKITVLLGVLIITFAVLYNLGILSITK